MSAAPEAEVASLASELLKIKSEHTRLEARTTEIYARLSEIAAGQTGKTVAIGAESSKPHLARRAKGQGDRIIALLRERPGADAGWLAAHVYGEDTPPNRQTLASMLTYLDRRVGKIKRVGPGQYEVIAMTK